MRTAALLIALSPCVAQAHAMLESTTPPVGSTVAGAPPELRLDFSEALEPRFSTVSVTTQAGAPVTTGAIHTDPARATSLLVPVGKLAPGTYIVEWHAVSVDTHKTEGRYHFTITP